MTPSSRPTTTDEDAVRRDERERIADAIKRASISVTSCFTGYAEKRDLVKKTQEECVKIARRGR